MTEDNWKLLLENGVLARYERKFRVEIDGRKMSTDDKQLIVRGHEKAVNEVIRLLQQPADEAVLDDISNEPTVTISEETWKLLDEYDALTDFRKGLKVDISARRISAGQWELTLSGPKRAVDRLSGWLQHAPRKMELPGGIGAWLCGQGPDGARVYVIKRKANVGIQISSDKRSALLIGSPSETDGAVAMINRHHCATRRISQVVRKWLCHKGKGSNVTRSLDLEKKFDTTISIGPYNEFDRTQMLDLTVVAERREDVERVFAHLDRLHKECFEIEQMAAIWLTNKRNDAEDARAREFDAEFDSLLGFTSDPGVGIGHTIGVEILGENADLAIVVEKVNATQLLFEYWFGHDGDRARNRPHHKLEDSTDTVVSRDDEAGLFHVAGRPEGVKEAVERINLHEIVLEVPAWTQFLVKECGKLQETTATGMGFSNDVIKRRVLVDIAGSESAVKRGMEEVIGRITSDHRYKEGDICLRRIKEQPVGTAGFKKTRDAEPVNLSGCTEPFSWKRLTLERWRYTGEASGGRHPKGPR